jgi:hypothetical protein
MAHRGRRGADEALAVALAAGQTVQAAADQAHVAPRTAYRRLADPTFLAGVRRLRAELVERALGHLADGMVEAAGTLRALLAAGSESVRLGAARSILELACRLRENVELEARLDELEARLSAPQGGQLP